MGLIACPACGSQVSEAALACPGCGHPIQAAPEAPENHQTVRRAGAPWEAWGAALCLVGMILGMAWNGALGGILFVSGIVIFIIGRFN